MAQLGLVVLACAALVALAAATNVEQCSGKSFDNLNENVQLSPCKKPPCRLKKGTQQHITINFTPDEDLDDIQNKVTAKVLGLDVPFVGVDGNSICDKLFTESGEKANCPVKAGTKYVYKDSFPVLSIYPTLNTNVHWELKGKRDLICFTVPVRIS
ncbi:ecdysteroid-regulated 16 kDa protein [Ostrinia nubilalis]|uniref:ecdysteroid-regulated 16 kDa protein n=1 Tax=Ostrinia furnacalis TaxID=93504 RepID=UPI00103EEB0B|nr:ecdysteroid-regulated 16 kDa protein [Ostrinia furnacalis]